MSDTPSPLWVIETLGRSHDLLSFDCGQEPLNNFLRQYAGQNERIGYSQTWVATRPGDHRVAGYYSLSAGQLHTESIPELLRRRLPRYPVPVAHLGRLAVDRGAQGQGLGQRLLFHAFARVLRIREEIGIHAIEVRAKDEVAKKFYAQYGFIELVDEPMHLYLPLKTVQATIQHQSHR